MAVLSIELSRPLDDLYDVERLTGLAEQDQIWWTEARRRGARRNDRRRVARALAELMLAGSPSGGR